MSLLKLWQPLSAKVRSRYTLSMPKDLRLAAGLLAAAVLGVAVIAGGCAAKASAPPGATDVILHVTAKGEVVADGTTYAPTGMNVSLDRAALDLVGHSPNKRDFYVRKGASRPAESLYLHTGKMRYDVWRAVRH